MWTGQPAQFSPLCWAVSDHKAWESCWQVCMYLVLHFDIMLAVMWYLLHCEMWNAASSKNPCQWLTDIYSNGTPVIWTSHVIPYLLTFPWIPGHVKMTCLDSVEVSPQKSERCLVRPEGPCCVSWTMSWVSVFDWALTMPDGNSTSVWWWNIQQGSSHTFVLRCFCLRSTSYNGFSGCRGVYASFCS